MAELVLGFIAGGLEKQADPKGREKHRVAPKTIRLLAPGRHNMFLVPRSAEQRDSNPNLGSVEAVTHQRS